MSVVTLARKLSTMKLAEIRGRLFRLGYTAYERRAVASAADRRPADGFEQADLLSLLPHFAVLRQTVDAFLALYPNEARRSIDRAEALLRGDVILFGRIRSCGSVLDWHIDPESGRHWPRLFHGDLRLGDSEHAPGDVKNVWELNRHQFLLDLGKAALITGKGIYGEKAVATVRDWIAANPYGVGVNWAGPLEVAYRALSWLWTYEFLREELRADVAGRREWLEGLYHHGRFLYRHLEEFESPFNHLISEASVLYILGVVLTVPESTRWRRRGAEVLAQHLPAQFYEDGGSVEQAPVYHHATLGFALTAALVGRYHGVEFPTVAWHLIERAIEFSHYMIQPDGRQPAIGDNDDARPLAFDVADNWDFRHFQGIGAVLFGRADFKTTAGRFSEDAFWLLGPDAYAEFQRIPAQSPSRVSTLLGGAGYAVMRSDWSSRADYVCFDCGEQAAGLRHDDIPSAAHGHADALAVVVLLGGRPVLVDSGFYSYNGDRAWERYFRETFAHNTVTVDGSSQALHVGRMTWTRAPRVTVEATELLGAHGWARASHDGYLRGAEGITHRRTVWLRPGGYVVLYDELFGSGRHTVELVFQLAPDLLPILSPSGYAAESDDVAIAWCASGGLSAHLECGGSVPESGWVAPHLGQRVAAPRLSLKGTMADRLTVLTVIVDRRVWPSGPLVEVHESGLVAYLEAPHQRDVVLAAVDGVARAAGYETDAPLAAWRLTEANITSEQVTGTFARTDLSAPLFRMRVSPDANR